MPKSRTSLSRRDALASLLALAPLLTAQPACQPRRASRGPARRVVTLAPNTTEILFALGAGPRVVGVSRFDDYPPEVTTLPRVGGGLDPSFEAIIGLRPDAVIGTRAGTNRSIVDRLEHLGVRTLFPRIDSLAEIRDAIRVFGELVGMSDRAPPLIARIDARVGEVQRAVAGRPAPNVLAVYGQRPVVAAGPGSFVDEMLRLAGARNALRTGPAWPTLSLEAVLALAPDVVLDISFQEGTGLLRDAWAAYNTLPAVRDGRIHRLENPMLARPGPRVGDALAVIARTVHPGVQL